MSNQKKNKIRLILELLIIVVFLVVSLTVIKKKEIHTELQLVVKMKISHLETVKFHLHMAGHTPVEAKWRPKVRFKNVYFNLPSDKVSQLQLNFGDIPGLVSIHSITIKSIAKAYTIRGKRIYRLFKQTHLTGKPYVKDNVFHVQVKGPGHWIAPQKQFYNIIEDLSSAKFLAYLVLGLLAIILFYFMHNFDPRSLKIFFSHKTLTNSVLIILLVLFFPLMNQFLNLPITSQLVEKRTMARKPDFRLDSLFSFPQQYTPYYNDHFTLRGTLIYYLYLCKYSLFNMSGTEEVVIGKNGWLFFGDYHERIGTIRYFRNITPMTPEQLAAWKNTLEKRKQWLEKQGIHYLFLIAPNKNTIYPEKMPEYIHKAKGQSRMDQFLTYLKHYSDIPVLDLRPILRSGKKRYPVYSMTDSHWNDYGAYLAYRDLIRYMRHLEPFKEARAFPLSHFTIDYLNKPGGDIAEMLSLHNEILRENMLRLTPKQDWTFTGSELPRLSPFVKQGYTKSETAKLPPILMVHDSFYKRLKPFLSEQFSLIRYIWDWDLNFYPGIIKQVKPRLVIDEMAERFLMKVSAPETILPVNH